MDSDSLKKIESIKNIKNLIEFISPYYPDINIKEYTIEKIEKELYKIYIKLIGRILSYSPLNLRHFLRDYLLKYEIMNIQQIILGTIIGMTTEEKRNNTNLIVHEYLDNIKFIEDLIKITSLEEIQLYLRNTKYNAPIREGILSFKNTNEIFVLEAFLDQLYYKNLARSKKALNSSEKEMIEMFSRYITEIYNINLIYRGILNNIDIHLLSQFIVRNTLFLDYKMIQSLINQKDLNSFFSLLNIYLKRKMGLGGIDINLNPEMEYPTWNLEEIYQKLFFKKFRTQAGSIDYATIHRIFELVIKKEKEIKFIIMPNVIRLLHSKYESLKSNKLKR
ncbi:MAG: V-type ATPase subunit [Candidatus Lokiarchaeota archaeon]|nr:V-type ATPase subunit [Candidatus Lokiarchaeota archaeon]